MFQFNSILKDEQYFIPEANNDVIEEGVTTVKIEATTVVLRAAAARGWKGQQRRLRLGLAVSIRGGLAVAQEEEGDGGVREQIYVEGISYQLQIGAGSLQAKLSQSWSYSS
ncbi:hypothetical protein GUJ93_ZPchr0006g41947 [Zizania palustris]|uniref:Uncharacterized protein n=1 Tax=Zizania palustris TaxID=103762 RepID=A0A8J5SZB7_ZIZPA|nr:hypothetical protein GUJ93_ZPchr0006g41947 [Zizania palustris]